MRKNLKDFREKEGIFVDANIFLHHAFDINAVSVEFLKKIESSSMKVYTSALVMEEITFKLVMQSASNFIDRVTLNSVKNLIKDNKVKEKVFLPVEEYREYMNNLKEIGMTVLDLTDKDMSVALQKAKTYGLITADAAHLAVMARKSLTHIATNDRDFEAVSGITVWSPE